MEWADGRVLLVLSGRNYRSICLSSSKEQTQLVEERNLARRWGLTSKQKRTDLPINQMTEYLREATNCPTKNQPFQTVLSSILLHR